MAADMQAWAAYVGLDIKSMRQRFEAKTKAGAPGHPMSSVAMLRGCLVALHTEGVPAMQRFARAGNPSCIHAPASSDGWGGFHAYWTTLQDVTDEAVLRDMHKQAGRILGLDDYAETRTYPLPVV